ncbi:uncharacterized protein PGTG_17659 [Puccinia graminis f. sp. tritici CRL 75-36-700-3]|uniref:Uncharacterized protein n=1 Tax=Puccinia graminis f. sp. tritici (strain CRL 75-36-700-3 / race SCCL) TaxID=418459 RepID=E3L4Y0_PUCGT|nr:uncharacterized protein PGTG_17659 [Puccinia graminis f. sp. tritici CRL 75-36-700-3]EFP91605.1 hypothetical protein PGTG_17659 [Puccinia graminis f. sp. tritici CRL 75-36-700-3]
MNDHYRAAEDIIAGPVCTGTGRGIQPRINSKRFIRFYPGVVYPEDLIPYLPNLHSYNFIYLHRGEAKDAKKHPHLDQLSTRHKVRFATFRRALFSTNVIHCTSHESSLEDPPNLQQGLLASLPIDVMDLRKEEDAMFYISQ